MKSTLAMASLLIAGPLIAQIPEETPRFIFERKELENTIYGQKFLAVAFREDRFLAISESATYSSADGYVWNHFWNNAHVIPAASLDADSNKFLCVAVPDKPLKVVLADFDRPAFAQWGNWQATGTAFGTGPALEVDGQKFYPPGSSSDPYPFRVANSLNSSQRGTTTGKLISPSFALEFSTIGFYVAGANQPFAQPANPQGFVEVRLVVDGQIVRRATGSGTGHFDSGITWDVSPWIGKSARIEIVDEGTGPQSWIAVGEIVHFGLPTSPLYRSAVGDHDPLKVVLADFDRPAFAQWGNWQATGTAFGTGPALEVDGQKFYSPGSSSDPYPFRVANSLNSSQRGTTTGKLISPSFVLDSTIGFDIAGANQPFTQPANPQGFVEVRLVVDGQILRRATGSGTGHFDSGITWDVSPWIGKSARIEIVDEGTGPQSWIAVREIVHFGPPTSPLYRSAVGDRWTPVQLPSISIQELPQWNEVVPASGGNPQTVLNVQTLKEVRTILESVSWDGSRWTAVGAVYVDWNMPGRVRTDLHPWILTSLDGIAWSVESLKVLPFTRDIDAFGSAYRASGEGDFHLRAVKGLNGATVAASRKHTLHRPTPASSWTQQPTFGVSSAGDSSRPATNRIAAADGRFSMLTDYPTYRVSNAGFDFANQFFLSRPSWYYRAIGAGNGWIATVGWENYFTRDGKSHALSGPANAGLNAITFGKDRFVAVGDLGLIGVAEVPLPDPPAPIPGFQALRLTGTSVSALAFRPNGRLGLFLGQDVIGSDQIERRRPVFAEWNMDLGSAPLNAAQVASPQQGMRQAVHLVSPNGTTHLLVWESGQIRCYGLLDGAWVKMQSISGGAAYFEACVGPDETLHIVFYDDSDWDTGRVYVRYARVPSTGSPTVETIAEIDGKIDASSMNDFDDLIDYGSHEARNLGIVIQPDGTLRVIFSPGRKQDEIFQNGTLVGTEVRSRLDLATKSSGGSWQVQTLLAPPVNGFGDYGGLGASLALAPDGQIGVAASVMPRVRTGSPGEASLVFAKFSDSPTWQTVSSVSANYRMGDGERGTGLFPKLAFAPSGRAHIVYTDHASEHFAGRGAKSFSGQVRYSRQTAALDGWENFTVLSAGGVRPLDSQVFHPTLAVRNDGLAAIVANAFRWSESMQSWQRSLFLTAVAINSKPIPPAAPPSATPPTPVATPAPAPDPRSDQLASLEKQLVDARKIKNPKARASRMRSLNLQISSLKTEIAGGSSGESSADGELASLQKQLAGARKIKNAKIRAKKIAEINAKIAAL